MAVAKKSVAAPDTKEAAAKTAKAVTPATPVKTEADKKEAAEKKAVVKKEAVKKEAVKKTAVKKETAPRKTAAKKAELKSELHIQFNGKSYSEEELVKIARDVWQYDLKKEASEFVSVELYVKPEESVVYYVINNEFTGSFFI